ncbi:ankyrin repeat domain-containing protein [Lysobacter enzymogenes]|uniref:ankyrin repeat domain-containing protein n=1 Tax=Lysobacter enzymogenes TaxID=69 RepID=UPI001A95E4B0|nr:ankyrin repeat domain-containing protein [Lysobacter enzymogenes]QQP97972.1 ankyrin repeat domain-containing protein [Lysobacter enzymogenes]
MSTRPSTLSSQAVPEEDDALPPLARAVRADQADLVRTLLAAGADARQVLGRGAYGRTALHLAAESAGVAVSRLLLDAGADPNARTPRPDTPDHFLEPSVDPSGTTALHRAAALGRVKVCALLVARGAHVRLADGLKTTALHLAAASPSPDACDLLLRAGAEVTARDLVGQQPLHGAAAAGDPETCRVLLRAGAPVDARDDDRMTPLIHAALNHRAEACRVLLDAGADPNATDEAGNTALHAALYLIAFVQVASPDAMATLKSLARAGANLRIPFPLDNRPIAQALRGYPAAQAAYSELLAERRLRALDAALPLAGAVRTGRPRARLRL